MDKDTTNQMFQGGFTYNDTDGTQIKLICSYPSIVKMVHDAIEQNNLKVSHIYELEIAKEMFLSQFKNTTFINYTNPKDIGIVNMFPRVKPKNKSNNIFNDWLWTLDDHTREYEVGKFFCQHQSNCESCLLDKKCHKLEKFDNDNDFERLSYQQIGTEILKERKENGNNN